MEVEAQCDEIIDQAIAQGDLFVTAITEITDVLNSEDTTTDEAVIQQEEEDGKAFQQLTEVMAGIAIDGLGYTDVSEDEFNALAAGIGYGILTKGLVQLKLPPADSAK